MFRFIQIVTAALVCLPGCSMWHEHASEPPTLPNIKMSSDSVVLEIAFVRVPSSLEDGKLWESVDELHIAPATRRHLNQNGFRSGLVGVQVPSEIRSLLDDVEPSGNIGHEPTRKIDLLTNHRRLHARAGHRNEIAVSSPKDELVVLHKTPSTSRVRGTPFHQAQCMLALKVFPQGGGHIQLELVPEIHHGQPRKQWVGSEGIFHMQTGREREVYPDLALSSTLDPGQTLVVSCTSPPKGVGKEFFVDAENGDPQQKLLLIRLAQTQRDDLFDDELADLVGP